MLWDLIKSFKIVSSVYQSPRFTYQPEVKSLSLMRLGTLTLQGRDGDAAFLQHRNAGRYFPPCYTLALSRTSLLAVSQEPESLPVAAVE